MLPMLGIFFCLVAALTTLGCAGTIRGQVVDAQTGQPIAGAVVLGVWTKGAGLPGLSHTELVGVREAETGTDGRFELEEVRGWLLDEKSITIYKFGYVAWNNLFIFPSSERRADDHVPPQIRLERFPDGGDHRRHIGFISGATRGGDNSRDAPKFFQAVQREWERR